MMSHAPDVTTHGASRQQASTSFVDASIHHRQDPVTLESLYYLLLGMQQRLDNSNARVACLKQTVPSPQHAGNKITIRQASQQALYLSKKQRRHNLRWRSKQRQLASWLKSMVTLDTVFNEETGFAATSGVLNPVGRIVRACTRLHVVNPADHRVHSYTRLQVVNSAGSTAVLYTRSHHFGYQGNTLNTLKYQFRAPHTLHGQHDRQTIGCTHQVFDPGGTYIQALKTAKF